MARMGMIDADKLDPEVLRELSGGPTGELFVMDPPRLRVLERFDRLLSGAPTIMIIAIVLWIGCGLFLAGYLAGWASR